MIDYERLSERLRAIAKRPGARLTHLGDVDGLPFWRLDLAAEPARLRICLASGIHGDEPAGVEALLRFLEAPSHDALRITAFPCMNPTGLVRGTREDRWGQDLNRCFDIASEGSPVALFQASVGGETWDLYLDLHEDDRARGFYTFEIVTPHPPLGPPVVEALIEASLPIESVASLEHLIAIEELPFGPGSQDGIVSIPPERVATCEMPQGPWMIGPRAPRGLTFETPSHAGWELRLAMHRVALEAAIRAAMPRK